jgi:nicotinamidase/pyrazinamidase
MNAPWMADRQTAHICVDQQRGFCEGGNLAVAGGNAIVPLINELQTHFGANVKTQDFHPQGHKSFASAHPGKNPFDVIEMPYGPQVLWPDHCEQGTPDADFHPDLIVGKTDLIIRKGTNPEVDSYSAFREADRVSQPRFANGETLADTLRARGIKRLVFTGLAFDYCVGWNALDAVEEGFEAIVVEDATRAIAPASERTMRANLEAAGVTIVKAADLPRALGVVPVKKPDEPRLGL